MATPSKRIVKFNLPGSSSSSKRQEKQPDSKFAIAKRKMKRPIIEEDEGNCDLITTEVKKLKREVATKSVVKEKIKITSRCFPGKVVELMKEIKKSDNQTKAVNSMGFNSMFQLPHIRFSTELLTFLLNNFDPNACCLYIRNEQLQISDIDVHLMFGLPLGIGSDIEQFGRYKTEVEEDYWNSCLGCFQNKVPNSESLKEMILKDIEGGEFFKRNFVVYLVSNFLAPLGNSRQVNWRVLKCLKDTSKIKDFNWCSFLLFELCNRIREYKLQNEDSKRNVGGCLLFLELFYLDRIQHGGQATVKRDGAQPRMIGWSNEIIRDRIRRELKEAKSFGFGKIVDDPLYKKLQAEREEIEIKGKRDEGRQNVQENFTQENVLDRFGELIDDVIAASHAVQEANKTLFAKIKKIVQEFPSQTVSICEYLKIDAPHTVGNEDEEYTSSLLKTTDLSTEGWMKAKERLLREYQVNTNNNKEEEENVAKERSLNDVMKEKQEKIVKERVEGMPTFTLLTPPETVEKEQVQIVESPNENISEMDGQFEFRLTSNVCRSLTLIDHPFLIQYSRYAATTFLSDEEIKFVNFVFTRMPKDRTRFVNICSQTVTSAQLQTLIRNEFVDRNIIFAWTALMNMLEQESAMKKNVFLCPYHVESGVFNIVNWMRNLKLGALGNYEMIFIPIIDCNQYYTIIFDIPRKYIHIKDMMVLGAQSLDPVLEKWKATLSTKLFEEGFEAAATAIKTSRRVHTKSSMRLALKGKTKAIDSPDSAIYMMRTMQYFDNPLMFETLGKEDNLKLHRIKIAAELLLSKNNSIKDKFLAYARDDGCP